MDLVNGMNDVNPSVSVYPCLQAGVGQGECFFNQVLKRLVVFLYLASKL